MAELADGETVEMKGSAKKPYVLSNVGCTCSCTCPARRNQSRQDQAQGRPDVRLAAAAAAKLIGQKTGKGCVETERG